MGNSESSGAQATAYASQVAGIVGEVVSKEAQDCAVLVNARQELNVAGQGGLVSGVRQRQTFTVKADCAQSSRIIASMQSDIENRLAQQASLQASQALFGGNGSAAASRVRSRVRNHIRNTVNSQTVQSCITTINANQIITASGTENVVRDVVQEQTADAVRNCMQSKVLTADFVASIKSEIDQAAATKSTNAGDVLGDVAKTGINAVSSYYNQPYIIAMVFIVIIGIAFIAYTFSQRTSAVPTYAPAAAYAPTGDRAQPS